MKDSQEEEMRNNVSRLLLKLYEPGFDASVDGSPEYREKIVGHINDLCAAHDVNAIRVLAGIHK